MEHYDNFEAVCLMGYGAHYDPCTNRTGIQKTTGTADTLFAEPLESQEYCRPLRRLRQLRSSIHNQPRNSELTPRSKRCKKPESNPNPQTKASIYNRQSSGQPQTLSPGSPKAYPAAVCCGKTHTPTSSLASADLSAFGSGGCEKFRRSHGKLRQSQTVPMSGYGSMEHDDKDLPCYRCPR